MSERPEHDDPNRYAELTGFEGSWRDLWWNHDFVDLMLRRLGVPEDASILDVGCGAGHWGRTLLGRLGPNASLTGVDPQPRFLEMARTQAAGAGLEARSRYLVGDATSLPLDEASFDLVTCQTVLIHVDQAAQAVRQMRRVAKPGAAVMAVEPDNLAGNVGLTGGEPRVPDDDVASIVRLQLRCDAGKRALGEGDNRIGARLVGLFSSGGLKEVTAYTSDRCIELFAPYDRPSMNVQLEQELSWSRNGISILLGTKAEALRLFAAGAGDREEFEALWGSVERWMDLVRTAVEQERYHAARGFVMVLTCGRA